VGEILTEIRKSDQKVKRWVHKREGVAEKNLREGGKESLSLTQFCPRASKPQKTGGQLHSKTSSQRVKCQIGGRSKQNKFGSPSEGGTGKTKKKQQTQANYRPYVLLEKQGIPGGGGSPLTKWGEWGVQSTRKRAKEGGGGQGMGS